MDSPFVGYADGGWRVATVLEGCEWSAGIQTAGQHEGGSGAYSRKKCSCVENFNIESLNYGGMGGDLLDSRAGNFSKESLAFFNF